MTDDSVRPGLHPLSQLKSGPTVSSQSTSLPISSNPVFAQPPTRTSSPRVSHNTKITASRNGQAQAQAQFIDQSNEKATVALIRRVFCPGTGVQSLEELLPPLTSSNEVDRQLYALLAIIVREYIYSWYSQITSDHILVNEVLQVFAHVTRALEQRLRQTDVAQLILDELPALVESHIVCKCKGPDGRPFK